MYIEINSRDLKDLMEAVGYVIDQEGQEIDGPMVEYLKGVKGTIEGHLRNERFGRLGGKGSGVALQIDSVLPMFQKSRGEADE